jgi:hypothetical protein
MEQAGKTSLTFSQPNSCELKAALSGCRFRPFLVTLQKSPSARAKLDVHVAREVVNATSGARRSSLRLLKREVARRVAPLELDVSIRLRLHSRRILDKPRSLEELIVRFGRGERLYDPTGAFEEAERLVVFALHLRYQLGDDLKGVYFSSRLRATCVLLNKRAFVDGDRLRREALIAAERSVVSAHQTSARRKFVEEPDHAHNLMSDQLGNAENVRLCFDPPAVPLVPIDARSVIGRSFFRLPTLSTLFGLGSTDVLANNRSIGNRSRFTTDTAITTSTAAPEDAASFVDNRGDGDAPLSSDGGDMFAGGPGLHLLWRDPVNGAVGQNTSAHQAPYGTLPSRAKTDSPVGTEMSPGTHQLFDAATPPASLGSSKSATPSLGLHLRWLVDGMTVEATALDVSASRTKPSAPSAMQPAIAAMLGRSSLVRGDSFGEAYRAAFEDLRSHFGLPRSFQAEARWHFSNAAQSSTPPQQGLDASQHDALLAKSESYLEWLSRMALKKPPNYDEQPSNLSQTQFRVRLPSAISSY